MNTEDGNPPWLALLGSTVLALTGAGLVIAGMLRESNTPTWIGIACCLLALAWKRILVKRLKKQSSG